MYVNMICSWILKNIFMIYYKYVSLLWVLWENCNYLKLIIGKVLGVVEDLFIFYLIKCRFFYKYYVKLIKYFFGNFKNIFLNIIN